MKENQTKGKIMEKKINNILFLTKEDGTKLTFKVLFTYHSDVFEKDYAVFYNEKDENHLMAYAYDENLTLSAIESQEEAQELNNALEQYDQEQANK